MDEQGLPKTASGVIESVGPEQGAQPGTALVLFGDPATVKAGFALALRVMGMDVIGDRAVEPQDHDTRWGHD